MENLEEQFLNTLRLRSETSMGIREHKPTLNSFYNSYTPRQLSMAQLSMASPRHPLQDSNSKSIASAMLSL